jgi:hypothetical protein
MVNQPAYDSHMGAAAATRCRRARRAARGFALPLPPPPQTPPRPCRRPRPCPRPCRPNAVRSIQSVPCVAMAGWAVRRSAQRGSGRGRKRGQSAATRTGCGAAYGAGEDDDCCCCCCCCCCRCCCSRNARALAGRWLKLLGCRSWCCPGRAGRSSPSRSTNLGGAGEEGGARVSAPPGEARRRSVECPPPTHTPTHTPAACSLPPPPPWKAPPHSMNASGAASCRRSPQRSTRV